ncbi:insulinase family protein [Hoylesella marshii]|uniref:M16 family metallopeptidase n=1 Tax=Hoylesella marshii TaxID=189722 RepID=UPI0028D668CC|nr:insulinase family protein [Hoylesella marshii]
MKKRTFLFLAVWALCALVQAQMPQMPPIPVDKEVRMGKLPNGLTYYIRKNNYPEHVANFYIAQRVGSINENDDQRGLAHFLEHMAFNGSEHFKDNGIIDFTRSLGVQFGSDLNAYTSIEETVYRVCNVPTKRQSALDSCLLILKDWSNGLTLDAKEIDKERGVVHGEWTMRNSGTQRLFEKILPKVYPGSKYGERLPIGLMSIIDSFRPATLRAYYKKWYRPDNQAIIVVGDVDVDHTEAQIKKLFSSIVVPKNAAQVVPTPVPDNVEPIYLFEKDKEQQFSIVSINMKHDATPDSAKVGLDYMAEDYVKNAIVTMLNARLSEMTKDPQCPFVQASAEEGRYFISKTKDAFELNIVAKEGKDLDALKAGMRELMRVRQHGFTATEYLRAKEEFLSLAEKAYTNRNKVKNDEYGDKYREHYLRNEPIPSAEDEYQIWKMLAPAIPLEAINEAAKELISVSDTNLVVYDLAQEKEGITYPTPATMRAALEAARAEQTTPYVDNVKNEPLITKMPKAGKIKSVKENKVLGYKEMTLSNGATVILKKTDFKDDEVVMQASAKGGSSLFDAPDYANLKLYDDVIAASGLGNFSHTELEKALAGKQAHVSVATEDDYQYVKAGSTPKDLETMMQLVYLQFTAINKDEKSFHDLMSQSELMLKNKGLRPESAFIDSLTNTINRHNPRFANLQLSDLAKVSYDRILQMAKQLYGNAGNYTFTFVGNFDEATLRPLIEQYIASLPASKARSNYRDVKTYATGDVKCIFTRKMETPKPIVFYFYYAKGNNTLEDRVKMSAVGQVLSMVLLKTVREDAGAAYSVGANGSMGVEAGNPNLFMQLYAPISDPSKTDLAIELMEKGVVEGAQKMDADMVQKVKDFMLKQVDVDAKTNSYWIVKLQTYKHYGVDTYTDYKKVVNELTPENLAAFLKDRLLSSGNRIKVVMRPE